MSADICDGCMNGCSLSQPGCPRGLQKATGNSMPVVTSRQAQEEYLRRQERIRKNETVLRELISKNYTAWEENHMDDSAALLPELAGMRFFDAPLTGISNAFDPLYQTLKKPGVVGPWFRLPQEWLPGCRRVISFFFPFSEQVRIRQREEKRETTPEWLHGRIEGQEAMLAFTRRIEEGIREAGYQACIPFLDPRFAVMNAGRGIAGYETQDPALFSSTWSERHVAFISGLGTFGLSRGIITEKGMAGRFCSIVTDMELPVTQRPYQEIYEWCIFCGKCAVRCPVGAITMESGKDHVPCSARIADTKKRYAPRYGCGQCQTAVPCEDKRP